MESTPDHRLPHPLWVEAAGIVQADRDVDVRLEARGLVVAEMADVSFAERLSAVVNDSQSTVVTRNGDRFSGMVIHADKDCVVLRAPHPIMIPAGAIAAVSSLPRVLHEETTTTPSPPTATWHSILRDLLGESLHINTGGVRYSGRMTWVGADHVSLLGETPNAKEVTIRWVRIDSIALPSSWARPTELR